jgi:hypothetical protein
MWSKSARRESCTACDGAQSLAHSPCDARALARCDFTACKGGQSDTGPTANTRPLFTYFGDANEGLPLNPRIALYYETTPDRYGFTPNPDGFGYRDPGLGAFLRSASNPNSQWVQFAQPATAKCKPRRRAMWR